MIVIKTILISTYKKYIEKKQTGEKEYEIRPFVPKCELPFKVVEYEPLKEGGRGKVIQEFIVNEIIPIVYPIDNNSAVIQNKSGVERADMIAYSKNETRKLYAWHITDLKVYPKPKELGEFKRKQLCKRPCRDFIENVCRSRKDCIYDKPITKGPQNLMYVEEI